MEKEKTLLLVDDEQNIVRSLVRLLRQDRYKILQANSAEEALKVLEKNKVGVILSDQRMPGMSGIEFLNKVKDRFPETVRLVLSGYTDLKSVTEAINKGSIYKFLTKPWEDDLIRKNIAEAFEYYNLKACNRELQYQLENANQDLKLLSKSLETTLNEKEGELDTYIVALQNYQSILNNLPIAIIGIDQHEMIVANNQYASDMFSVDDEPIIQSKYRDVLGKEISELVEYCSQHDMACTRKTIEIEQKGKYMCCCSGTGLVYKNICIIITLIPVN